MNLERIPNGQDLWSMLNVALKQPPEVRRRIGDVARLRAEEVERGHFGGRPLPKEIPARERDRLSESLKSFWWAMNVIGTEYSVRTAIEHLVPMCDGRN